METILAMAVGPEKNLMIDSVAKLNGVRPYITGLVRSLKRQLGTDYKIDYRERELHQLVPGSIAAEAFKSNEPYRLVFAMSSSVVLAAESLPSSPAIIWPSVSDFMQDRIKKQNSTGVSAQRTQSAGDCLLRFIATVPTLESVNVLHNPGYPPSDRALALVERVARSRNVVVRVLPVQSTADIKQRLVALRPRDTREPAFEGVLPMPIDVCFSAAPMIIHEAQEVRKIPVFLATTDLVRDRLPSALGGFGVSQHRCGELVANFVEQVLFEKGKPADLPVKQAATSDFEWVVSAAAARDLNIPIVQMKTI
jgi:ABC-type uncharacterized transport system substrate-binding protein